MNIDKLTRLTAKMKEQSSSQEQKEAATAKAHDYIILGYTLMNAADIVMRKTVDIMKIVSADYKYMDTFEIRKSLSELESVIRRTDTHSQKMDGIVADISPEAYDRIRENAFEILRFVMLLYSRTCGNDRATRQLEAYMRRIKSNGLFTDEDIANFRMR